MAVDHQIAAQLERQPAAPMSGDRSTDPLADRLDLGLGTHRQPLRSRQGLRTPAHEINTGIEAKLPTPQRQEGEGPEAARCG